MDLSSFREAITVIGVVIALATLIKGVIEYTRRNAQTRAQHFIEMLS